MWRESLPKPKALRKSWATGPTCRIAGRWLLQLQLEIGIRARRRRSLRPSTGSNRSFAARSESVDHELAPAGSKTPAVHPPVDGLTPEMKRTPPVARATKVFEPCELVVKLEARSAQTNDPSWFARAP